MHGVADILAFGIPGFLALITPIVFFHELGHFTVARLFGVKIDTFSIGFGREIFGFTDRKGTRWKFSWLPLGGYVKFFGDLDEASAPDREMMEKLSPEERARAYQMRPVGQRALISVAGPVANFILAMVIYTAVYMIYGVGTPAPVVGAVIDHSPAKAAGILPGDRITSIDGRKVATWDQMVEIVHGSKGRTLSLAIARDGKPLSLTLHTATLPTKDIYGAPFKYTGIGVQLSDSDSAMIMHPVGIGEAVTQAGLHVQLVVDTSLTYVWRLFTGRADSGQLTGPVGIFKASSQVVQRGLMDFLALAAFISVSIGLVNLFPIPVLDGGHLLYYGVEAVLGRPLGAKAQDAGFRLGLVVVLGLLLFATFNDLIRPGHF
ncbi:MAG TPA: RIP metalloprotease RseP [Rhizomicrobium sp.]|nr:RIP metalloprotease RseP [Rhizomicrobium sp.]